MAILVRQYNPEVDDGMIYGTWLAQIKRSSPFNRMLSKDATYHRNTVIPELIKSSEVFLVVNDPHTTQIFSWICYSITADRRILHMIYTRSPFRKQGYGKGLMRMAFGEPNDDIYMTHLTESLKKSNGTKRFFEKWELRYNPYLIWPGTCA